MSSARSSDVAFTVFVGATQERGERTWKTPGDKANLIVFPALDEDQHIGNPEALRLSTIRSHDRHNTTIYANSDPYRGVFNRRDVPFLNPDEIKKRGFAPGDRVDVRTLSSDGMERLVRGFKVVSYRMPDGCCAAHYPKANPLMPRYACDPLSGTPSAKAIPVVLKQSSNETAQRSLATGTSP
jgi:anaerobic selenocysteine-containing dehydrogenase